MHKPEDCSKSKILVDPISGVTIPGSTKKHFIVEYKELDILNYSNRSARLGPYSFIISKNLGTI